MPVSTNAAHAALLSDGSGTLAAPPYYNGSFSGATLQYEHTGGVIQRLGAGWGSVAWDAEFGPDTIATWEVSAVGESEFEIRGVGLGSGSTWDAYSLGWNGTTGWTIYRTVNGATTSLATATQSFSAGDTLGFEAVGAGATVALAAARYTGGAWASDFITYNDTNAARLVAAGRVGWWSNGTTMKVTAWSAGTIPAASSRKPGLTTTGAG